MADHIHRRVMPPDLMGPNPQQMQAVGMTRIKRQSARRYKPSASQNRPA